MVMTSPRSERLQKVLARAGVGSRRQIEDWLRAGRISVDGKTAGLGAQISGHERVELDGRRLPTDAPRRRVLAYYKPEGEICTRSDPAGRPSVYRRLPRLASGRWMTVGRLDINSQGLLLVTTDGELAERLSHPARAVEREYAVRVLGTVDQTLLDRLRQGVQLDDGLARFDSIVDAGGSGANHWYHVVLREGRKREVRRLWESQGVTVSRLARVRYGPVQLRRGLRPGHWDELTGAALNSLLSAAGLPPEQPAPGRRPRATTGRNNRARPRRH